MRRADNLTTFVCRMSWNLGASNSWNPLGLSRPVMGLLYLFYVNHFIVTVVRILCLSYSAGFCIFFLWLCDPTRVMASSFLRFLDHTQRLTTVGRTPLDEWSARRRDPCLTTHNTHNRQTSMPPVGFEPMIPAGKRPQTYALDRAASGTGMFLY